MDIFNFQKYFVPSIINNELDGVIEEEIIPIGQLSTKKVIEIYNADYFARITEAIGENFESLWFVLGDEEFFLLCEKFILQNPSHVKNLSHYGANLPQFLEKEGYKSDYPFIIDLALFEVSFWKLFHLEFNSSKLSIFNYQDIEDTKFSFDFVHLFTSKWDVVSIWRNRESKADDVEIDWDNEIFYLLYRNEEKVNLLKVTEAQYEVLVMLKEGCRLDQALERANIEPEEIEMLFKSLRINFVPISLWDPL